MDTLEGIQHLFDRAKSEPVQAFDVVASVRRGIRPLQVEPPAPNLTIWKISGAVSALAAVIPLAVVVKAFGVFDEFLIDLYLPTQVTWLW